MYSGQLEIDVKTKVTVCNHGTDCFVSDLVICRLLGDLLVDVIHVLTKTKYH